MSHKWTEGEVRRYIADREKDAAFEVLQYLCERGPDVVKWGDLSDPEVEEEKRSSARVDTLDRRIEGLVERVVRDERELGVLSTGEQIAVAVVLDRRDLVPPPYNDSWQDALDRLGDDWLAACRRVASRRATNDDASFEFIRSIGARR